MSRRALERRRLAEERWPLLSNLMARHFNQDLDVIYGSLEGALASATSDGSLEHRRAVLGEWKDWNVTEGAVDDIRAFLADGFLVDLTFETALGARQFMNLIYDRLLVGVRADERK